MHELSHERIEELASADAIDGLEAPERGELLRRLGEHGPDCPECRRLLTEFQEVAGELALALEPEPVRPGAEERLLARARLSEQARSDEIDADARTASTPRRGFDETLHLRPARWLVAATVALTLVVGGVAGYLLALSPSISGRQVAFAHFVAQPGTQLVTMMGARGRTLTLAYHPGKRGGWVAGAAVEAPPAGKVYELWYLPSRSGSMHPAGLFVPQGGKVLAIASVQGEFTTVAVSVEPHGGSPQPTSQPVYIGRAT